jgi:DNA polymerase III sliding clamp (beta) subunit (PCNA family)
MKTNRKSLVDILGLVSPALSTKEVVENSTCFIFANGRILTYNDEVSISHKFDIGFEGAVKGKEFLTLLQKMGDEEIDLETTESHVLITGTKTKAKIRVEPNNNLNELLDMLGKPCETDWKPLPETFRPSVDFCMFSVGRDPNKPLLTTVYVGGDVAVSSDDNRITVCQLGEGVNLKSFCLPVGAVKELKSFLPVEYTFTDGWIHLRTKELTTFSSRVMMGLYPVDRARQIVDGATGELLKLPNGLIETLERTGIFTTDGKTDRVQITIDAGFLTVVGEGPNGSCEETARVRYSGAPLSFDVSPEFLKNILQHTSDVMVGQGVLRFDGLGFTHVMTVKLSK